LRLAIEDDGEGVEQYSAPSGIGSRLIQAFAIQVGGSASVQRRQGGGTVVSLVFPDPDSEIQDRESEIRAREPIASET
jgi:two-component sensor histidine kinase